MNVQTNRARWPGALVARCVDAISQPEGSTALMSQSESPGAGPAASARSGGRCWIREPLAVFGAAAAGGVVLEGGVIVELLARGSAPTAAVDSVLDARQLVLLPGLINTHHHFYQTLTRAHRAALDKPLFPWLKALYPVWARLTDAMIEASTELALAELLLSGTTTAVDHHYVFSDGLADAIDHQVAAAQRLRMRVVLTRGSMSLGESAGGLPPDAVVQSERAILDDCERLIGTYHEREPHAMVQIALAPCSPFSVTRSLLQETAQLARREDLLLHTHLAETADEEAFCVEAFGQRPVDYLEQCGWLTERSWFAHGIHFSPAEIARLGAAGCSISHCPTSNMLLSSGLCPVPELEAAGVAVSLGVDGSASNDGSNLMQEVRQALLLQRLRLSGVESSAEQPALPSHLDALRWATAGGARALRRPELGQIAVGAAADLALFAVDDLRFSGAEDPLAALVLCGAHRARAVCVAGRWLVEDGAITGLDLAALRDRHQLLAAELWAGG